MVLKELILTDRLYFWKGVVVLKELFLTVCNLEMVWVVLKELIFNSFYIREGVVVLKELIFNSFYFGEVWWS